MAWRPGGKRQICEMNTETETMIELEIKWVSRVGPAPVLAWKQSQ